MWVLKPILTPRRKDAAFNYKIVASVAFKYNTLQQSLNKPPENSDGTGSVGQGVRSPAAA